MKLRVIKRFIDKEKGLLREVNTTFDCSKDRLKEIKSAGDFVEIIEPEKASKRKEIIDNGNDEGDQVKRTNK